MSFHVARHRYFVHLIFIFCTFSFSNPIFLLFHPLLPSVFVSRPLPYSFEHLSDVLWCSHWLGRPHFSALLSRPERHLFVFLSLFSASYIYVYIFACSAALYRWCLFPFLVDLVSRPHCTALSLRVSTLPPFSSPPSFFLQLLSFIFFLFAIGNFLHDLSPRRLVFTVQWLKWERERERRWVRVQFFFFFLTSCVAFSAAGTGWGKGWCFNVRGGTPNERRKSLSSFSSSELIFNTSTEENRFSALRPLERFEHTPFVSPQTTEMKLG